MKLATAILKKLLLPKLEKDSKFEVSKITESFLESFAKSFCDFEKDTESVYQILYRLELNDTEKINSKLAAIYIAFIKELAENYVLGNSSEVIDYLVDSKNKTFEKEVEFFTNLKNAITKIERKRIKEELPTAFDKLTFEISDNEIELAIRKKERESLKEKMKVWDSELSSSDEKPVYTINNKPKSRVISLSWIQYAAAACVILAVGVFFFKQSSTTNSNLIQPTDNNVVSTPVKSKAIEAASMKNSNEDISPVKIEEISISTVNVDVLKNDYGFAPDKQKIKIVVNDQKNRVLSLEKALHQYQTMVSDGKHQYQNNKLKALILEQKTKLKKCKSLESRYMFDGKELTLYAKLKGLQVLEYNGDFYLKMGANYYKLILSKQSKEFEKVTDSNVLEALEKIIFKNE